MITVVIVDDDPDLMEMVGMVLKYNAMDPHCISRPATLTTSLAEIQPDLILMDIYMGEFDGRKICFDLKTSDEFKHIPVILYSAGVIIEETITQSFADDFINKPFENVELINKIHLLVDKELKNQ